MNNNDISQLFKKVAAAYLVKGENRFKIIAYEKAADIVKNSTREVKDLWRENKLDTLPGIGTGIASHLDELFKTGKVKTFAKTFSELPAGMFTLLDIPGFGPKRAFKLASVFKLNNPLQALQKLLETAKAGKIAKIEGFGAQSEKDIIEAIERFKRGQVKENRMPLPYAAAIAQDILSYLKKSRHIKEAVSLGSLRRMVSTIGDIDIAVSTNNPRDAIKWFISYPTQVRIIEQGETGATILLENGRQIDLRVQTPHKFGSMIQYFTGNKQHNIHLREYALKLGLSLSEYGIKILKNRANKTITKSMKKNRYNKKDKLYEFDTEEKFYAALGLKSMPPQIREDRGEIEASQKNYLPKLVTLHDIQGDLHIHSNYDLKPSHDLGSSSIKELLIKANQLGYEYIGISDHNPSIGNHNLNQIISIMKRRKDYIEQIKTSTKSIRVNLFIMLEIDILPNGKLALPDVAFDFIDAAIVSIHSSFNMDKATMTKRIISGLSHPKAKILAHPSGRLINERQGYEVDWDTLFGFCHRHNKALEINAYPVRLDLVDTLVREAVNKNVKMVINTDTHEKSQMDMMKYGVSVAQRGWAAKHDILNTLSYNNIKYWLKGNKK